MDGRVDGDGVGGREVRGGESEGWEGGGLA
jgi:hypothetical protein